jgi:uncharacterized damage-inducible protein DinB
MMKAFTALQYEWIKDSRKVLFDYCRTVSKQDFTNQNTSFGRGGSMRNLLVHIANTYQFWIANTGLRLNVDYPKYENIADIEAVIRLFDEVDAFMETFIETIDDRSIIYKLDGATNTTTPLRLFTHVITHEFHHKGQILSISRHLGYTPVDTDVMR